MPLSESRKKKLQMLLKSVSRGEIAQAQELLRAADAEGAVCAADAASAAGPLTLLEACPGVEVSATPASEPLPYWLIRRTLAEVSPDCLSAQQAYGAVMRGARQRFDELQASADLCRVADARGEDLLFMDTETCGLAGAMIFLVGLMYYENGQLIFEQHLARDYAEEPAVLDAFARRLASSPALVTFNGKAFDMTLIRERCAFHAVAVDDPPAHLDLLHESRRRWRSQLPNCKLQTLEKHFCGRHRVGDIPGAQIPDAYHTFVRTGDARRLGDILHHNLLDLLTMAELLTVLLTSCQTEA